MKKNCSFTAAVGKKAIKSTQERVKGGRRNVWEAKGYIIQELTKHLENNVRTLPSFYIRLSPGRTEVSSEKNPSGFGFF